MEENIFENVSQLTDLKCVDKRARFLAIKLFPFRENVASHDI